MAITARSSDWDRTSATHSSRIMHMFTSNAPTALVQGRALGCDVVVGSPTEVVFADGVWYAGNVLLVSKGRWVTIKLVRSSAWVQECLQV